MSELTEMTELLLKEAAGLKRDAAYAEFVMASEARPSFRFLPRLFIDGNQWCALFGENLQDGVAGFGDSPEEAYSDFDKNWYQKLPKRPA